MTIVINVKKLLISSFIIGILITGLHLYFNIFSPTFVKKPYIEKPSIKAPSNDVLQEELVVTNDHIEYLANEIGAYKLHKVPFSEDYPELEFRVSDYDKVFTIKIIDGTPESSPGEADNPDLVIYGMQEDIVDILSSGNINDAIVNKIEQGRIGLDVKADEKTLALKGYMSIYNALKSKNDITAQAVKELEPAPFSIWTATLLLVYVVFFVEFFFRKQ